MKNKNEFPSAVLVIILTLLIPIAVALITHTCDQKTISNDALQRVIIQNQK